MMRMRTAMEAPPPMASLPLVFCHHILFLSLPDAAVNSFEAAPRVSDRIY